MKRRRRLLAWSGVAALVLALGAWSVDHFAPGSRHRWAEATRGDLVSEIEVTGTLKAIDTSVLGPPLIADMWEFKVSFLAPEGSDVRKGSPVIAFDTTQLTRELEQKVAERDTATTEIDKTRGDLGLQKEKDGLALAEAEARLRKVALKLDVPVELAGANERRFQEIERDTALAEVAYLRGKIESSELAARERMAALESQKLRAQGRVQEIQAHIEQMRVTAPRDGTVVYVPDWRGEKVKVGDSTWRSRKILEIPDLSKMAAVGEVDESDAGRVSLGRAVRLRLDAHPDDEFRGRVVSLGNTVGRQTPRNPLKVLRIEVSLERTDRTKMRPGMRFRGSIETGRITAATLVPLDAIFPTDRGPVAYRRRFGSLSAVPVELGARNAKSVQVRSGLKPGDVLRLAAASGPDS